MRSKNKSDAERCLKWKNLYLKKSDQYYHIISTLEDQLHTLETSEVTKSTMKILNQVNLAKEQVKQDLEEVENTFEKLA